MSIQSQFIDYQNALQHKISYSNPAISACIDLTLLDHLATKNDIENLASKGWANQVAAFCVYPEHLDWLTPNPQIKRATVINFPEGKDDTSSLLKLLAILQQTKSVDEIDYVFPWQSWLQGHEKEALHQAATIYEYCQHNQLKLKIIMETGAIADPELIFKLATELLSTGVDFLKTSTGKIPQGASPIAAFAILQAIMHSNPNCGIKISGGVKTIAQATEYMTMAETLTGKIPDKSWFRIGASNLPVI